MTTLYKIAEQVKGILGKGEYQELIESIIDSYSSAVKTEWYENKNDGISEVDGAFIYTFGKSTPLVPAVDIHTDMYCIVLPSSALRLPHEMGINQVSFMKGQTKPFVRINSGSIGMWANVKSNILGGSQTYFIEGTQMFFPKMDSTTAGNILLKMAIALDGINPDEELNIPRSIIDKIVLMVVQKYSPKVPSPEETINN